MTEVDSRRCAAALWPIAVCGTCAAAIVGFWITGYSLTQGRSGVPLDDAWIHFQFARNIAEGTGFAFNPGEPTAGSTSPLWTLMLAAVYWAGGSFPLAGQVLSAVTYLAIPLATYALARSLVRCDWLAWLSGLVVALNGRLVWAGLSALETGVFTTLALLSVRSYLTDRRDRVLRWSTALLLGLATLARPEGYLLSALVFTDSLLTQVRHRARRGCSTIRQLVWPGLLYCVVVMPYIVFSFVSSGHLLPNTYHAKVGVSTRIDWSFLSVAAKYLILDNVLLMPFFVFGLILLAPQKPVLVLWCVGLPIGYALIHAIPYQHGRYLMPLIPFNAAVACYGVREFHEWVSYRWRTVADALKRWRVAGCALALLATAWRLPTMAQQYAWNVDNISSMHVEVGLWIDAHTPEEAVLALNDIGAITYISRRYAVDLAGLVTPEVVPILRGEDAAGGLARFMAREGVDYAVVFPNWFPELVSHSDWLEPVHSVELTRNTIAGGPRLVVYQTNWPTWSPSAQ